jgi:hypothetical protein
VEKFKGEILPMISNLRSDPDAGPKLLMGVALLRRLVDVLSLSRMSAVVTKLFALNQPLLDWELARLVGLSCGRRLCAGDVKALSDVLKWREHADKVLEVLLGVTPAGVVEKFKGQLLPIAVEIGPGSVRMLGDGLSPESRGALFEELVKTSPKLPILAALWSTPHELVEVGGIAMEVARSLRLDEASQAVGFFAELASEETVVAADFAATAALFLAHPPDGVSSSELRGWALIFGSVVGSSCPAQRARILERVESDVNTNLSGSPDFVLFALVASVLEDAQVPSEVDFAKAKVTSTQWAATAAAKLLAAHPRLATLPLLHALGETRLQHLEIPLLQATAAAVPEHAIALLKPALAHVRPGESEFEALVDFFEPAQEASTGWWLIPNSAQRSSAIQALVPALVARGGPDFVRWMLSDLSDPAVALWAIGRVERSAWPKDLPKLLSARLDTLEAPGACERCATLLAPAVRDLSRTKHPAAARLWLYAVLERELLPAELEDLQKLVRSAEVRLEQLALFALLQVVPRMDAAARADVRKWLSPVIFRILDPAALFLAAHVARAVGDEGVLKAVLGRASLPLTRRASQVFGNLGEAGGGNPVRVQLEGLAGLPLRDQLAVIGRANRGALVASLTEADVPVLEPVLATRSAGAVAIVNALPLAAWAAPLLAQAAGSHRVELAKAAFARLLALSNSGVDCRSAARAAATDPAGLAFLARVVSQCDFDELLPLLDGLRHDADALVGVRLAELTAEDPARRADFVEHHHDALARALARLKPEEEVCRLVPDLFERSRVVLQAATAASAE